MKNNRTNYNEFITYYNEIDEFMRKELDVDVGPSHTDLIKRMARKNKVFEYYKDDLIAFARLRNAIVHNPDKRDADPIAEPHDFVIEKYRDLCSKVMNPPKALDTIAVKSEDIFTAKPEDNALKVMKVMSENAFTHVPIIEKGKVIGVFSENTVFSYAVRKGEVVLKSDTKIREFSEFIPMNKHESEYFRFAPRDVLVIDVEDMFAQRLEEKKLAVVFITHSGHPGEELLGLVTAWDVAGYREK